MKNEQTVKNEIRAAASATQKSLLWVNNCGVAYNKDGQPIRFGLANSSTKENNSFKSSDLIGITRRIITPDMVGQMVAIFTAIECKREDWKFKNTLHEEGQKNFLDYVRASGGIAFFANSVEAYLESMK